MNDSMYSNAKDFYVMLFYRWLVRVAKSRCTRCAALMHESTAMVGGLDTHDNVQRPNDR
jgi:hypothetical protein